MDERPQEELLLQQLCRKGIHDKRYNDVPQSEPYAEQPSLDEDVEPGEEVQHKIECQDKIESSLKTPPKLSSKRQSSKPKTTLREQQLSKTHTTTARRQPTAEESRSESSKWLIAGIILTVVCWWYYSTFMNIFGYFISKHDHIHEMFQDPRLKAFQHKLIRLKNEFPHQPKINWHILNSGVIEVLNTTSDYGPSVVVLLASENAESLTDCIAKKISRAVSEVFSNTDEFAVLSAIELAQKDPDDAKHVMDDYTRKKLDAENLHVLLITDVDQLPGDSAMFLQGLFDQETGKYKKVVYVLTISTHAPMSKPIARMYEKMASDILSRKWNGNLGVDKTSALINRVVGNVIMWEDEEIENCEL